MYIALNFLFLNKLICKDVKSWMFKNTHFPYPSFHCIYLQLCAMLCEIYLTKQKFIFVDMFRFLFHVDRRYDYYCMSKLFFCKYFLWNRHFWQRIFAIFFAIPLKGGDVERRPLQVTSDKIQNVGQGQNLKL